jgi:uncharacterized membrane protein
MSVYRQCMVATSSELPKKGLCILFFLESKCTQKGVTYTSEFLNVSFQFTFYHVLLLIATSVQKLLTLSLILLDFVVLFLYFALLLSRIQEKNKILHYRTS